MDKSYETFTSIGEIATPFFAQVDNDLYLGFESIEEAVRTTSEEFKGTGVEYYAKEENSCPHCILALWKDGSLQALDEAYNAFVVAWNEGLQTEQPAESTGMRIRLIDQAYLCEDGYAGLGGTGYELGQLNPWRDAVVEALESLGVRMRVYEPSDEDAYMEMHDSLALIVDIIPTGTLGYSWTGDGVLTREAYAAAEKRFYYHFEYNGADVVACTLISPGRGVVFMVRANGEAHGFKMASTEQLHSFVTTALPRLVSGGTAFMPGTIVSTSAVDMFLMSSARLTEGNLAVLLSGCGFDTVWWHPAIRYVVASGRDSSGKDEYRVLTLLHSGSGWRISATVPARLARSGGRTLLSQDSGCPQTAGCSESRCREAVVFSRDGEAIFLPFA